MVELEDKTCASNEPIILLARSSNASQGRSYGRRNGSTKSRERGIYLSGQERSSETYSHYHVLEHSESIY